MYLHSMILLLLHRLKSKKNHQESQSKRYMQQDQIHLSKPFNPSVSQQFSQSSTQPTSQSNSQSATQSSSQSIKLPASQSMIQPACLDLTQDSDNESLGLNTQPSRDVLWEERVDKQTTQNNDQLKKPPWSQSIKSKL